MNEIIKRYKTELLEKLKNQKKVIENRKTSLTNEKFSKKKTVVDQECVAMDTAFAKYKQERLALVNEEFAKKLEEINATKSRLLANAQATATAEAEGEIAMEVAEYDSEIAKLEKELA